MKHTFKLNDRVTRYDQVILHHGHEIGTYGYFSNGEWTVTAHIDGETLGYYPNLTAALEAARTKIEDRQLR